MSNCAQLCPYADENEECFGDCQTMKPIEELNDVDLERGKSPLLIIKDENNGS